MEHRETSMDVNNNEDPLIVTAHFRYNNGTGTYGHTSYRRNVTMPGPAYTQCQVCRANNARRFNRPGPLQLATSPTTSNGHTQWGCHTATNMAQKQLTTEGPFHQGQGRTTSLPPGPSGPPIDSTVFCQRAAADSTSPCHQPAVDSTVPNQQKSPTIADQREISTTTRPAFIPPPGYTTRPHFAPRMPQVPPELLESQGCQTKTFRK